VTDSPVSSPADSLTPADVKARFSASWSEASQAAAEAAETETEPRLEQAPMPCPPGYVIWRIRGTQGRTMMPQLLPHPPPRVCRNYLARVISNLTGTCPICRQTAWIDPAVRARSFSADCDRFVTAEGLGAILGEWAAGDAPSQSHFCGRAGEI
jgi:hypothetical protein